MISTKRLEEIVSYISRLGFEKASEHYKLSEETLKRYQRFLNERIDVTEPAVSTLKTDINLTAGTNEITFDTQTEIRTLDELIDRCHIDTKKWEIVRYVQNYWGNRNNPNWQVKVWLSVKTEEQLFQDAFIKFLKSYKPGAVTISRPKLSNKPDANLVINKQDAHLNKYDVHGNNNIEERFANVLSKVQIIVQQASFSNHLNSITYIIGSDILNSEFTNATTKGTPQQNTHSYQQSFEFICGHEIQMINMLLSESDEVNIIFVPGNHDEYAGWHIVNWLKTYFRSVDRVNFDTTTDYRKYMSYGSTAVMFNHGDAIKPEKLASIFPIEYKEEWSKHQYFYIFTGDKHHEMSKDLNGIKFYQLPAFSSAKSLWDEKNGYTCSHAEATGFLIDKSVGITNIFKQYL